MTKTWSYAAALLWGAATSLRAQQAPAAPAAPVADSGVAAVRATPTLQSLLDSAALHAALARLHAPRAGKRTERVFLVTFDSAGQPRPVRAAVPRAMPEGYRDAVTPLIQAALRPMAPIQGGWQAMLLVEAGTAPRIEQVFLPQRQPSVANMPALNAALYEHAQRLVNDDGDLEGRECLVHVALRVDEDGIATPQGIARSSGNRAVDDAALRAVRVVRFHPALLDEEPAPARVILPIRFVFPKE